MTAWYEVIIEGRVETIREILPGVASDGDAPVWGEELDLHAATLPERLLEMLGARTHHLLFVPSSQIGALTRTLQSRPEIRLERVREILGGGFSFQAEVYSQEAAARIREALHALPAEVRLEDFEEDEKVDPDARGVELYAPLHEYTYRASGRFTGLPSGLFEVHRKLKALDFVHQDKLELEGREVEGAGLE
ncbi:MAG TPA: hypothetical protein VEP28_14510 [Rubrobacter sp.]|nr:hypothetical protein [Rubrobacter sp.]